MNKQSKKVIKNYIYKGYYVLHCILEHVDDIREVRDELARVKRLKAASPNWIPDPICSGSNSPVRQR